MLYIVIEKGRLSVTSELVQRFVYTVKKVSDFPLPSHDIMPLTKLFLTENNFYSVQARWNVSTRIITSDVICVFLFQSRPRSGYDLPLSLPLWGVGDVTKGFSYL
jgi:hypothetical protein